MNADAIAAASAKSTVTSDTEGIVVLSGQSPAGEHVLSVLFKRTYDIIPRGPCTRAAVDVKLYPGDMHYDGPMNSSVKYESDFVPWKTATDVVFNGTAYAPDNRPTQQMIASLSIGMVTKRLYIVGDRTCTFRPFADPGITKPVPFTEMDIRYERAFGGVDIYSHSTVQYPCPRNHLGRGFIVKNKRRTVEGLQLPNIEDPDQILHPGNICCGDMKNWSLQPVPQGLGWYFKCWQPRAALAGIMPADRAVEQELRQAYTRVIPESQRALYEQTALPSMDFTFFNGASPGLAVPFLNGDEKVHCVNLSPERDLSFQLPGNRPFLNIDVGLGEQQPECFLHTVMIRMEERQIDLVWRGACTYPGPDWLPEMKKKEISLR